MRTLVFDEVDAGVGGGAAEGIGRRLKKLASTSQVLCVTHLPQVASFADHHYCVEKRESNGRTVAAIEELDAGGEDARNRPDVVGTDAYGRGAEECRAADSNERKLRQMNYLVISGKSAFFVRSAAK